MFGLFKQRQTEAEFLATADQRMRQSDSLTQMLLIMELIRESTEKQFYVAQIALIARIRCQGHFGWGTFAFSIVTCLLDDADGRDLRRSYRWLVTSGSVCLAD